MFSGLPTIFGIKPSEVSSTPKHQLGTKGISSDGRIFRYAKNSSTEIATARLCIMPDVTDDHENIVFQTAGVIGDNQAKITVATTSIVANEYVGGYMVINDGTGQGYCHLITGHGAGDGTITFDIKPTLQIATETTTTVQLIRNPFYGVLISDGTHDDTPVGVTPRVITASYYFWLQTGGVCSCLMDATVSPVVGQPVTIGDVTSGAVEVISAVTEPIVGHCFKTVTVADDDDTPAILLTLDS